MKNYPHLIAKANPDRDCLIVTNNSSEDCHVYAGIGIGVSNGSTAMLNVFGNVFIGDVYCTIKDGIEVIEEI